MKTSTKNTIKLVIAALAAYGFISSLFSIVGSEDAAAAIGATVIYFVITAALLYSVYRSNKKHNQVEKEQQKN